MYPPVVLTVIRYVPDPTNNWLTSRHTLPNATELYPGLAGLTEYTWYQMIILAAVPCKYQLPPF
jgi:hypothetical protein